MDKGIFIVIEGVDGAGKGYAMMRLQEYIMGKSKKYDHLLLTREPTYGKYGRKLREMDKTESNPYWNPENMLELQVADKMEHVTNHILPALEKGYVVLCDRYIYSTMAYSQAQGIPLEKVIEKQISLPIPDLVIILDCSAEEGIKRIDSKINGGKRNMFEEEEFMKKVRNNYLAMPKKLPRHPIKVVDASKAKEEVFEEIRKVVEESAVLPY